VKGASITKVSKRLGSSILAFEMKITYTCKGCAAVITGLSAFDVPSLIPKAPVVGNCACSMVGKNLVRAPHEAEFHAQYQQVVQSFEHRCFPKAPLCSYGTPFMLDMAITVDIDGASLTPTQMSQAVEAFTRASNSAYTPTQGNCQPEFRRLENVEDYAFTTTRRQLDDGGSHNDDSGRALQQTWKRMVLRLKSSGTCNACSGKAHVGNRVEVLKGGALPGKLQQVEGKSNCYCPLGSSVATEPPGRTTIRRLFQEELARINSPIKNVIGMTDDIKPPKARRLQSGSPFPPPPDPEDMTEISDDDSPDDDPSACPMIKLDFDNFANPMARWYGQSSTLKGGDYLFNQLWWTHGVKVSARIRNRGHSNANSVWIPKFIRGTGWVDSRRSHNVNDYRTGGAAPLFDTLRPKFSKNKKFHQPLCPTSDSGGDGDLGSPHVKCPGGGPGKHKRTIVHFCSLKRRTILCSLKRRTILNVPELKSYE